MKTYQLTTTLEFEANSEEEAFDMLEQYFKDALEDGDFVNWDIQEVE